MKTIRNILILIILSILIAGCIGEETDRIVEIGCDEFDQQAFITDSLTINSDEQFNIKLCSNPSTGFQWIEEPENTNPDILSQDSHDFIIQEENGTPLPPGTPGVEIWAFTAKASGQTRLLFEYSRDWEGGEKGTWTYTLEVTVK